MQFVGKGQNFAQFLDRPVEPALDRSHGNPKACAASRYFRP